MRSAMSGTTRTSAKRMPWTCSQLATWAMFLSCVRPERISSPMTTSAAVQILSAAGMVQVLGEFVDGRYDAFEPQHAIVDRPLAEVAAVLEVVLVEPPRQRGRALRDQRAGTLEVARGERNRLDFRQAVVLGQIRAGRVGALGGHRVEHAANVVGVVVRAQRPARVEIAEHDREVGHIREHAPAVEPALAEIDVLA